MHELLILRKNDKKQGEGFWCTLDR